MVDVDLALLHGTRSDAARGHDVVIRTEQLCKSYGSTVALVDVDLEVRRGEVFAYLGPNGAGKTTTLRVLLGLLRPTSGRAEVLGLDAWHDSVAIHREVGYVPGEVALWGRMTGLELLRFFAGLRGRHDLRRAHELAERLELDLARDVAAMSKGNRQKLAVVQALMPRPALLVLDEPTSGLDPLMQQQVQDLLREHVEQGGTVLLSSHILSEVQRVADRVGIIRSGALVAVERLDDLRAKSLHSVTIRFAEPVDLRTFTAVAGVRDAALTGDLLTCGATQAALGGIVKAAAPYRVVDLSVEEASLEDMFLAFYGTGA